ncbi:arylamine N-acetyltransferase [Roseobacter cerasinus]|uniref:Arylamine N-acetyltransferase n=1 Tax=Roseobacter cerasinus TaxID=2602289 RepID=A0A640VUT6_9RHOB|nr:arylamine N-acetyltransferase [Roseobacter cerasinus]GFE51617.1 arylamine N-acetyltransferase [Roseobacter cerasinus]
MRPISEITPGAEHETPPVSGLAAYLRKIRVNPQQHADDALLSRLHEGHVRHIPFEMIDAFCGLQPLFDLDAVAQRLIFEPRGGGCTQMNGLFANMAEQLGFAVRRCLSRVNGKKASGAATHMVLLIAEGGVMHLCDVGYGLAGPIQPIPLINGAVSDQGGGRFRAVQVDDEMWQIDRFEQAGGWSTLYSLRTQSYPYIDFMAPHHFNCTSPRSPFTSSLVCARPTPDGGHLLLDKVLRHRDAQGACRRRLRTVRDLAAVLQASFGIALDASTLHLLGQRLGLSAAECALAREVLA